MIPAGGRVPDAWANLLPEPIVCDVDYSSVTEAPRLGEAIQVQVDTRSSQDRWSRTAGHFFTGYQQRDEQTAPPSRPSLPLEQRHRAAAYAAAAGAVGLDVVVTNMETAGRSDVADNDIVISLTPEEAVPLIGHYLRVTSNPVVMVARRRLVGGGTWETTESTVTVVNLYDWGTISGLAYFDAASTFAAGVKGGPETAEPFKSIRIRLSRAARAFDHLLAALSNPLGGKRKEDVAEAAAEAFDRELLYLSAAFDIYGRTYQAMIDPAMNRKKARRSLDSREFINNEVRTQYDESLMADVTWLRVYAWLCKQLRNHIHDGILAVDTHPGRDYGNTTVVALNVGLIPELAPGADNEMTQSHYDALGLWRTEPRWPSTVSSTVADIATTGFTLMRAGLEYVEAFTKLIIRNKPANAVSPNGFLGCVQAQPGEGEPPPPERAVFYQSLFGLHAGAVS